MTGRPIRADELRDRVAAVLPDTIEWRRTIHRWPELGFEEVDTASFVAGILANIEGVEDIRQPTRTSVVARIRGGRGGGATIALRADLDALEIAEETGLPFASQRPGVMHACGHDGHTASLLGAARVLAGLRATFAGEFLLLFQHAEEVPPGGARELVELGILDGVDAVLGLHLNGTTLPTGRLAVCPGAIYASVDNFTIEVVGGGGHAAYPHEAVDPVPVAAAIITGLQSVVARTIDPLSSAVLSVTRVVADGPFNVIPTRVQLGGTVRALDRAVRAAILASLERVALGTAEAHGARVEVAVLEGYPVTSNDPIVTRSVRDALAVLVGTELVVDATPEMGADDFAYFAGAVPGCFVVVGAVDPTWEHAYPHHHPRFLFDEAALRVAMSVLVGGGLALLSRQA